MKNPLVYQSSHSPHKALLIGCVDARLDPASEIGLETRAMPIMRSIAAVMPVYSSDREEAAAINHYIEQEIQRGLKHIINMGHTQCGGLNACACGKAFDGTFQYIPGHLGTLEAISRRVQAMPEQARAQYLETESVRTNIHSLLTYPAVQLGIHQHGLSLHGWIVDTGSKALRVLSTPDHPDSGMFEPFLSPTVLPRYEQDAFFSQVISNQRMVSPQLTDVHKPRTVVLCDTDEHFHPKDHLNLPYGSTLIHRETYPASATMISAAKAAVLEFAIQANNIRDVRVVAHIDGLQHTADEIQAAEQALIQRIKRVNQHLVMVKRNHDTICAVSGYMVNVSTRNVMVYNEEQNRFHPHDTNLGLAGN